MTRLAMSSHSYCCCYYYYCCCCCCNYHYWNICRVQQKKELHFTNNLSRILKSYNSWHCVVQ